MVLFAQEKRKKDKKVEITGIPYLNYSQSQDLLYGAVGLATFKMNALDTISPRSTAGISLIGTTQKSYFGVAFAKMFFNEDKWRVATMAGLGTYQFQTFIDEPEIETGFYDYVSRSEMFTVRVLRKVYKKNYLGIGYHYDKVKTHFTELPTESTLTTSSLEFVYVNDSRNNVYYPTKGIKASVVYTAYPDWLNETEPFSVISAYSNFYLPIAQKNVLALRAYSKFSPQNLDFQKQILLGQVDLRGYTDGKYRGDGKFDVQGEYRQQLTEKFGLVGFGGLATVYGSDSEEFNWKLYPSVGVGARYKIIESTGIRCGFDVARGKDDWAFYFRIGESF